jgi:hypothetical protein
MNTQAALSEAVVASALRHCFLDFLSALPKNHFMKKFLANKVVQRLRSIPANFKLAA